MEKLGETIADSLLPSSSTLSLDTTLYTYIQYEGCAVKNGITNDFVLYWHQLSEMTAHRGRHFSPDLQQSLQSL